MGEYSHSSFLTSALDVSSPSLEVNNSPVSKKKTSPNICKKMHLRKVHLIGSLLPKCITMHGPENVKCVSVQQAKQIYQYKKIKEKLCKTNAAIW